MINIGCNWLTKVKQQLIQGGRMVPLNGRVSSTTQQQHYWYKRQGAWEAAVGPAGQAPASCRCHSKRTRGWSASTTAPGAASTLFTTPSTAARSTFRIFIASTTATWGSREGATGRGHQEWGRRGLGDLMAEGSGVWRSNQYRQASRPRTQHWARWASPNQAVPGNARQ